MTPEAFRAIRLRLGLTQAQLAKRLNFADANQVYRMETGRRSITPAAAERLRKLEEKKP